MTDLDTLRPEVREAVDAFDIGARVGMTFGNKTWNTIRAELLRLADENARLRDPEGEWINRGALDHWKDRAEEAEAELAALRARIAEAPISTCGDVHAETMGGCDYCMLQAPPQLSGKRVRLLVEK